jgi:3-phosphoinositide dependent protein kinase-1
VSCSRVAAPHEGHTPVDDDGIGWTEDAHGAEFERYKLKFLTGTFKRTSRIVEEVGPLGEFADYISLTTANDGARIDPSPSAENVNTNGTGDVAKVTKEADKEPPSYTTIPQAATLPSTPIPIPIPSTPHNGNPPGSGLSSSRGSLVDKPSVVVTIAAQELERGRNRALTPVQGNGRLHDVDL